MEDLSATNRSLLRGLEILQSFVRSEALSLSNIAAATGLAKSTTSRYVSVLVEAGYLRLDDEQRYRLTSKVLELGFAAQRSLGIDELVGRDLQEIADFCCGAANIGQLDGDGVIVLARRTPAVSSARFVSLNVGLGSRLPALFTAMGRALLSTDGSALQGALATADIQRPHAGAIFKEKDLRKEIERAARDGIAEVRDQLAPGFGGMAVPVKLRSGRTLALSGSYLLADHGGTPEGLADLLKRKGTALAEGVLR